MLMNRYSTISNALEKEPHNQIQFSVILNSVVGYHLSAGNIDFKSYSQVDLYGSTYTNILLNVINVNFIIIFF